MSKNKEKVNLDPKYIIKLAVTLFLTCCVVAGLLGAVNMVTEPNITAINKAKTEEATRPLPLPLAVPLPRLMPLRLAAPLPVTR